MLGTGSTLTFWSKYQIENSYDKGVVEISDDGGSSWDKVPVNYPGNSTNTSDACNLGTGAFFTGSGAPVWAQYSASLAAWDGVEVMLRWRFSSDGSVTYAGWWVDDIAITNVMVPSDCDSGEPPLFADGFETGTTNAWSVVLP
jgi:bacillopeptidase F (M6 metalloprotease family)